ncbi:hypothetical protein OH76DRAFT_1479858 [Lentinus brumalis]|uniref:Uncharacterized protein n=1 Tax=Lentinus brumalis TaxID=2498619 RepID=A0A371DLJ6_9APHY|nr:hypothetical protein OH76DRAFT_1479858 [Polyporus brumalis]
MDGKTYQENLMSMCASGQHEPTKKYGIFGIIMAVVCFPCGLICLFKDVENRCVRCGAKV